MNTLALASTQRRTPWRSKGHPRLKSQVGGGGVFGEEEKILKYIFFRFVDNIFQGFLLRGQGSGAKAKTCKIS